MIMTSSLSSRGTPCGLPAAGALDCRAAAYADSAADGPWQDAWVAPDMMWVTYGACDGSGGGTAEWGPGGLTGLREDGTIRGDDGNGHDVCVDPGIWCQRFEEIRPAYLNDPPYSVASFAGNFTVAIREDDGILHAGFNGVNECSIPAITTAELGNGCGDYVDVAVGSSRYDGAAACAVQSDGVLRCWADPGFEELETRVPLIVEAPAMPLARLGSMTFGAVGVDAAGVIHAWGHVEAPIPDGGGYQAVAGGYPSLCAIDAQGAIQCTDPNGWFGPTPAGQSWVEIANFVYYHFCAVDDQGQVDCFVNGGDTWAEPADALRDVSGTATGEGMVACGIRLADDTIACWGNGIGDISAFMAAVPADPVDDLSLGPLGGCAILSSTKDVVCWGSETVISYEPPVGRYVDVSVGNYAVCAIHERGRGIQCLGEGDQWNVEGARPSTRYTPSAPWGRQYQHFEATYFGFCATFAQAGQSFVECWGGYIADQVNLPPVPSVRQLALSSIAGPQSYSCELDVVGDVHCAGHGPDSVLPDTCAGDSPVARIDGGAMRLCWVTESGQGECTRTEGFWDEDAYTVPAGTWERVVPSRTDQFLPTCGIHTDHSLECWGYDWGDPSNLRSVPAEAQQDVADVGVGLRVACALKTDGTIRCWGDAACAGYYAGCAAGDANGCYMFGNQCALVEDLTNSTQGCDDTFAVCSAGNADFCPIWAETCPLRWQPANDDGTPSHFTALSMDGDQSACAIRADGRLVCWGPYVYLQPADPDATFIDVEVLSGMACALRAAPGETSGSVECFAAESTPPAPAGDDYVEVGVGPDAYCGRHVDGRVTCAGLSSVRR